MNEKKLGKGLEFLLNLSNISNENNKLNQIPVNSIDLNRYQPRTNIDDVPFKELTQSIKENGLLQPIVVKKNGERHELIAGERRLKAFIELKKTTIPAFIIDVPDHKLLQLALIENIQRENLNPIDEAKAYKSILTLENISHEELANRVGKNRTTITNALRLLELPEEIQDSVSRGTISQGHARTLLSFKTESEMLKAYEKVKNENLSVRDLEKHSKAFEKKSQKKDKPKLDVNLKNHVAELQEKFHTKAKITVNKNNNGTIKFYFYTFNDYTDLINKFLYNK